MINCYFFADSVFCWHMYLRKKGTKERSKKDYRTKKVAGSSQGLKIRGARSTVVGIICPPGWDKVNCLAKNWGAKAFSASPERSPHCFTLSPIWNSEFSRLSQLSAVKVFVLLFFWPKKTDWLTCDIWNSRWEIRGTMWWAAQKTIKVDALEIHVRHACMCENDYIRLGKLATNYNGMK